MATLTYTHVGRRAQTGNYAVTADAIRKPGKTHALNAADDGYRGLCDEWVAEHSGDSFSGKNDIWDAGKAEITCRRCLRKLGV